jgi:hypothetical protein
VIVNFYGQIKLLGTIQTNYWGFRAGPAFLAHFGNIGFDFLTFCYVVVHPNLSNFNKFFNQIYSLMFVKKKINQGHDNPWKRSPNLGIQAQPCMWVSRWLFQLRIWVIQDMVYFLQDLIVSPMLNLLKRTMTYPGPLGRLDVC